MSLHGATNAGHNIEQLKNYIAVSKVDFASLDVDYQFIKDNIFHFCNSSLDPEVVAECFSDQRTYVI